MAINKEIISIVGKKILISNLVLLVFVSISSQALAGYSVKQFNEETSYCLCSIDDKDYELKAMTRIGCKQKCAKRAQSYGQMDEKSAVVKALSKVEEARQKLSAENASMCVDSSPVVISPCAS